MHAFRGGNYQLHQSNILGCLTLWAADKLNRSFVSSYQLKLNSWLTLTDVSQQLFLRYRTDMIEHALCLLYQCILTRGLICNKILSSFFVLSMKVEVGNLGSLERPLKIPLSPSEISRTIVENSNCLFSW